MFPTVSRLFFFANLLLALVLGFAIGAGIGWINGQKERLPPPSVAEPGGGVVE